MLIGVIVNVSQHSLNVFNVKLTWFLYTL